MPRIYDPTVFRAQGAMITFGSLFKGLAEASPDKVPLMNDLAGRALSIYLRWQVNPRIGLPSEPFKVWRRPATPLGDEGPLGSTTIPLPPLGTVLSFDEPVCSFSGIVGAGSSPRTVVVLPLADGVGFENLLGALTFDLAAGESRTFTYQAPYVTAVLLMGTGSLGNLSGLRLASADAVKGWELVETVGLPVEHADWSDLPGQDHGVDQGLVGATMAAKDAAANRYARGINPLGWYPLFPGGRMAPKWELPTPADLVAEAEAELLPMLHDAMALPPEAQAAFTRQFTIHPPENVAGQQMNAQNGTADVSPLTLLQLAVSTDPLQAVALGFGTGYAYEDVPTVNLGAIQLFGDPNVSDWDYMVTGLWATGLDGESDAVEYAALIPRPRKVIPAPAPADLRLDALGHRQPATPDAFWTAAVRLSWERLVLDNVASVASFAVGRSNHAVTGPASALMEHRPKADGHLPIGDARHPQDPEGVRQGASDSAFPIPNDPGTVHATYGVATQNIFGIWSPWVTVPFSSTQPAPDVVQLVAANLMPTDPGAPATVCPATLELDFVLDWRVRRVASVRFRGRLFAAASRHQSPPSGFPGGMQKSLTGAPVTVEVTFAGDTPSSVGGSVICLDEQGERQVAAGAATQGQSRRYRLTVTGFALDFAGTPHFGLALQGRQTESLAPSRTSAWTPLPKVTYASDPRARGATITPIVPLASQPDASGSCHARLDWAPQSGAQGYAVYTSNELTLLERTEQPHPQPEATLSERLVALRDAFDSAPDRNAFTRINDGLLQTTSLDVTLPRGSQAIHCWVVLPVSAGGVEAPWPSGSSASDALMVYAAPKVGVPAPPRIEVRRIADAAGFAAALRVETRGGAGARPRRIDLYRTRVADAAKQVDSMGFPIATVDGSAGVWTTEPASPASDEWIETLRGTDAPGGSWKHVWYRAVAWADPLPERGVLGGRSPASPAVPVVVPPDGPPPLSPLSVSWPGGGIGDVQVAFTTTAPEAPTPLGPHTLAVDVVEQGVADAPVAESSSLHSLATAAPGAGDSGVWRESEGAYRLLIRRTDVDHAVSVTIRLTDPLGRTSERTHRVEAGSLFPVPIVSEIQGFTIVGRGKFYTFTISDLLFDLPAGQGYRLELTLKRPATVSPFPDIRIPRRDLPTPMLPQPGPMIGLGPLRSGTQFTERAGVLVFSGEIDSIPTTPPAETFAVSRQRVGQQVTITLIAREKLSSVQATVTSPDGTAVTRRARG